MWERELRSARGLTEPLVERPLRARALRALRVVQLGRYVFWPWWLAERPGVRSVEMIKDRVGG
jgi:hypothetical protein